MLKNRTIVALALLVLVGGATVWKVTRKDPHVADVRSTRPVTIPKDIDELSITDAGKPTVTLKKDGAAWKVTAPYEDRADAKAIEQAVDALAELKLRDVIAESPESYEKVGVKDDEVLKVVARKGGTQVASLLVGKTSNVRLEGDPKVWSTASFKRWALARDASAWRDRKILDFPVDQVAKLEVVYPAGKVAVKKETPPPPSPPGAGGEGKTPPPPSSPGAGPDQWSLVEGEALVGGALDANVAIELASTLARLNADDIAPADAKTGLDAPRARITATLADGRTQTLLLGGDDGKKAFVKVEGAERVWQILKYEADRLPATPTAWRDKTLAKIAAADVTKIELVKGDSKTVVERAGADAWKATTPATLEVEPGRIQALLRTTEGLRATKVLPGDAKANGLDKPRGQVAITTKDGKTWKLVIGAEKDGEAPVQVAGQKDVYALPSYLVGPLLKSADEMKKSGATAAADPHAH